MLRQVMRRFPTGVVVVMGDGAKGRVGVSINSFTSVSLEPPLTLFCISRSSETWRRLSELRKFSVNVLAADQAHVARDFSAKGVDRFAGVQVTAASSGFLRIAGAVAAFDCVVESVLARGDHHIVLSRVLNAHILRDERALVFVGGEYE
ncbi:flavin reductase family protein [Nonomuraea sp. SMC257]|uniref:Flavin reductase family protein n=1 Tax=Nonomuraea montanisoli TaxID=2741721 RepID=A0A7Y6M489_9ACTN|nr:flavin reductase family protein [Nonomuraea montanisoli]NUW34548.1 flavin reductase family protein [Nonomuraea montanisoli]